MTRFSAETLDLSRFPAPLAIRGTDYEVIMAERKTRLVELYIAYGIDYDVDGLETDPAIAIEQNDAYRELQTYAAVNDAVRAVMVAFATGADLDHLAVANGVSRLVVTPATDTAPAVLESDDVFRRRVLLAPEAFGAAGPRGAYIFHALTADPRVANVDVWSPSPGRVNVAVQSYEDDGIASDELLAKVRAHLYRDDIKPLTDVVSVMSVTNHPFSIDLEAFILPGPDAVAVKTAINDAVLKMAASRRIPSRDMPRSAIFAAAQLLVVDRVSLALPIADIAMGDGQVAILDALEITVTVHAG